MSLPQRVTKTHATGNDFVVYLDKSGKFEPTADEVRFLCDRHFGIGGDGLIRLTRPDFVSDLSDDQLSLSVRVWPTPPSRSASAPVPASRF